MAGKRSRERATNTRERGLERAARPSVETALAGREDPINQTKGIELEKRTVNLCLTMKVASTLLLTTLCCASAFGLHGTASKAMKKVGLGGNRVPMVQPIDITGERSSAITVSELFLSFT